jgi:hypothetical protein
MSDVGPAVIDHVCQFMQIDEEWSVRSERQVKWWSSSIAQTIWADETYEDGDVDITRFHCRTDFVRDFTGDDKQTAWLNEVLRLTSVSAPIRTTGGGLQLTASLNIHDEVKDWLQNLLNWVAVLQIAEAWHALMLAGQQGVQIEVDTSEHPKSGLREEPDDLLNTVNSVIRPLGEEPSRWLEEDFSGITEHLKHPPVVMVNGDEEGIAIEYPFVERTSLLRAMADQPHPLLGSGCLFLLSLPEVTGLESSLDRALELNGLTHEGRCGFAALGSWCPADGGLTHATFLPSAMHHSGSLFSHLAYEIGRTRWVTEDLLGYGIEAHFESCFREKMTSLGISIDEP